MSYDINDEKMSVAFGTVSELLEGIGQLDADTHLYRVKAKDLRFFHVECPDYDSDENAKVYITKFEITSDICKEPLVAKTAAYTSAGFENRFGGSGALAAALRDGRMVVTFPHNGQQKAFIFSDRIALNSLASRCSIGGSAFQRPSIARDAFIQELMLGVGDKDVNLITRGIRLFGVMSGEYSYVPQEPFFHGVFDALEEDLKNSMEVGECGFTHDLTAARITFGKMGEEIAKCYPTLPTSYTPGILVMTSDTGACSMKVYALWKTGTGNSLLLSEKVTRRHVGTGLFDFERAKERIFAGFEDVPKKLVEQMTIHVPSGAIAEVIREVADRIGLQEATGKRLANRIVSELIDEQPATNQSAYDITSAFMSLPRRIEDNPRIQFALELAVARCLKIDYEKIIKRATGLVLAV